MKRSTVLPIPLSTLLKERRRAWRYQLKLGLKFKVCDEGAALSGYGETCDISRKSVRFTADTPLQPKSRIDLSIDWPAKVDEPRSVCLNVAGTIVRCDSRGVVVLIRRYDLGPAAPLPGRKDSSASDGGQPVN